MGLMTTIRRVILPMVWQRHLMANVAEASRRAALEEMARATPDNPALRGFRVYSQTDEDGIIEEIFRRIGGGNTFIELGCGDGLENNTAYLLVKGWSGVWIDGDQQALLRIRKGLGLSNDHRLIVENALITTDNISKFAREVDFLSIDLDGNDVHILRRFLESASPKVICAEYNAKFPPPVAVSIAYNPVHRWSASDYFGASLQAFVNMMTEYRLVACGVAGLNAFFVRKDLAENFTHYSVDRLYRPFRIELFHPHSGHPPAYGFMKDAIQKVSELPE